MSGTHIKLYPTQKVLLNRGTTVLLDYSFRAKTSDNALLFFFHEVLSFEQTTILISHTEGTGGPNAATFGAESFRRQASCRR